MGCSISKSSHFEELWLNFLHWECVHLVIFKGHSCAFKHSTESAVYRLPSVYFLIHAQRIERQAPRIYALLCTPICSSPMAIFICICANFTLLASWYYDRDCNILFLSFPDGTSSGYKFDVTLYICFYLFFISCNVFWWVYVHGNVMKIKIFF